jgi:hypothetical protein
MPNRNLTTDELRRANELLADIRERLTALAAGDPLLLFAYRRKVAKDFSMTSEVNPDFVASSRL